MSLFKTKEWWRTTCGSNEFFHKNSLLVTPFLGEEIKDVIIVGSTTGYLRIYSPSSRWSDETKSTTGYQSTDLIIEIKLSDGIIDMKTGKFVSGSSESHLAVLTLKKLIVFNVSFTRGPTEYGDRCALNEVYEHQLSGLPVSLITGSFGGVEGREFFCIQHFDGMLQFFEQEAYMFSRMLTDHLLPSIILYNWKDDYLITLNSNWIIEIYKYSNIAESARKLDKNGKEVPKELKVDQCCNIGEDITDMNVVTLNSFKVVIFVLGIRNMYCFNGSNLSLMFMKKMDYSPLCCWTYVTEPDGQLMVAIVSDTNTLLIYENTTLKWSAQFPYKPVSISRANTQFLEGVLVILSADGVLEACYLGSEPSVFTEPRIFHRNINNQKAVNDMKDFRELVQKKEKYGNSLSDVAIKTELLINVSVSHVTDIKQKDPNTIGKIVIQLSSYITLSNVQVYVEMPKPLTVTNPVFKILSLCQKHVTEIGLQLEDNAVPKTLEFYVIATYINKDGDYRFLQKSSCVPLKFLIRTCAPENVASLNVTIKSTGSPLHVNELFPDFIGESAEKQTSNSLGLQHIKDTNIVTIVMGLMSNRYRVQSNNGVAMSLIVQKIVSKVLEKSTDGQVITVNHNHVQLVVDQMEVRFEIRQRIHNMMLELDLVMSQLREIEKRILRAMVERNVKSLSTHELMSLLETTYSTFLLLIDEIEKAQKDLEKATHNLQCLINLMLSLTSLYVKSESFLQLKSAIRFEPIFLDEVNWEEVTDLLLSKLLHQSLKKIETEAKPTLRHSTTKDEFNRLKQHFVFAFDNFNKEREMSEIAE